jgi:hypothetical protein
MAVHWRYDGVRRRLAVWALGEAGKSVGASCSKEVIVELPITHKYNPTNIWKIYLPVNKLDEPTSIACPDGNFTCNNCLKNGMPIYVKYKRKCTFDLECQYLRNIKTVILLFAKN